MKEKIAVEIKTFMNRSRTSALHFFQLPFVQSQLKLFHINLLIYRVDNKSITESINY